MKNGYFGLQWTIYNNKKKNVFKIIISLLKGLKKNIQLPKKKTQLKCIVIEKKKIYVNLTDKKNNE
jgi:hypothetical protein